MKTLVGKFIYGVVIVWLFLNAVIGFFNVVLFWPVILHLIFIPICMWAVIQDYRRNTWQSFSWAAELVLGLQVTWLLATTLTPWTGGTETEAYVWSLLIGAISLSTLLIGVPLLWVIHKWRERGQNRKIEDGG